MLLRPMTMADADKMLEWKNYSETRKFSIISNLVIDRNKHMDWLLEHLDQFQVIQGSNNTIGAIRINNDEISIWIDRTFRSQGIASYIIEQVAKPGMIAKIVEGNVSSMRAFIKAGFMPTAYYHVYPSNIPSYYIFKR